MDFDPDLPEVLAAMETASENPNDDWLDDDFVKRANEGADGSVYGEIIVNKILFIIN